MRFLPSNLLKNLLNFVHFSGLTTICKPFTQGQGIILMLHHILPSATYDEQQFKPNGLLEITPDFLTETIEYLQNNNYEIISMDEAYLRISQPESAPKNKRPFVVFTIDDGYLDNLLYAYPVFKKYNCPFTIFVTTDLCNHNLFMWWRALDAVVRNNNEIIFDGFGINIKAITKKVDQKNTAYKHIYWQLRDMSETDKRNAVLQLSKQYGHDPIAETKKVAMTWAQLKTLEADALVTIGAHTIDHSALSKLSDNDAKNQIENSAKIIKQQTDIDCDYFCYPYGSEAEVGLREFELVKNAHYKAAVTTQKGMIYSGHREHLYALPRVSLNGEFQNIRYLKTYLSGLPFMLWNKFRKIHDYSR